MWTLTGYGMLTTRPRAATTPLLIGNDAPAVTAAAPAFLLMGVLGPALIAPLPVPFRALVEDAPMSHANAPQQLLGPAPEVATALAVRLRSGALGQEAHAT